MDGVFDIGSEKRKKVFGRYEVSNLGVVYSDGLPLVAIGGVGVNLGGQRVKICDLVAHAFVPNIYGKKYLRHKNGDRKDNRACNLYWADEDERVPAGRPPVKRWFGAWNLGGESVGMWQTVREASVATGAPEEAIRRALNRKQKQAGGLLWRWFV